MKLTFTAIFVCIASAVELASLNSSESVLDDGSIPRQFMEGFVSQLVGMDQRSNVRQCYNVSLDSRLFSQLYYPVKIEIPTMKPDNITEAALRLAYVMRELPSHFFSGPAQPTCNFLQIQISRVTGYFPTDQDWVTPFIETVQKNINSNWDNLAEAANATVNATNFQDYVSAGYKTGELMMMLLNTTSFSDIHLVDETTTLSRVWGHSKSRQFMEGFASQFVGTNVSSDVRNCFNMGLDTSIYNYLYPIYGDIATMNPAMMADAGLRMARVMVKMPRWFFWGHHQEKCNFFVDKVIGYLPQISRYSPTYGRFVDESAVNETVEMLKVSIATNIDSNWDNLAEAANATMNATNYQDYVSAGYKTGELMMMLLNTTSFSSPHLNDSTTLIDTEPVLTGFINTFAPAKSITPSIFDQRMRQELLAILGRKSEFIQ